MFFFKMMDLYNFLYVEYHKNHIVFPKFAINKVLHDEFSVHCRLFFESDVRYVMASYRENFKRMENMEFLFSYISKRSKISTDFLHEIWKIEISKFIQSHVIEIHDTADDDFFIHLVNDIGVFDVFQKNLIEKIHDPVKNIHAMIRYDRFSSNFLHEFVNHYSCEFTPIFISTMKSTDMDGFMFYYKYLDTSSKEFETFVENIDVFENNDVIQRFVDVDRVKLGKSFDVGVSSSFQKYPISHVIRKIIKQPKKMGFFIKFFDDKHVKFMVNVIAKRLFKRGKVTLTEKRILRDVEKYFGRNNTIRRMFNDINCKMFKKSTWNMIKIPPEPDIINNIFQQQQLPHKKINWNCSIVDVEINGKPLRVNLSQAIVLSNLPSKLSMKDFEIIKDLHVVKQHVNGIIYEII